MKAEWSQVLAVHADDASGILARSNGLSSQDKELCKEPTIRHRYLFFGPGLNPPVGPNRVSRIWAVGGLVFVAGPLV